MHSDRAVARRALGALSEQELGAIFEELVAPRVFARAVAAPAGVQPQLIAVAGQPGAGKTRLLASAAAELKGGVELNGDDLRQFHPLHEELKARDPLAVPDVTAQASGWWVRACLDRAFKQRTAVAVETTLRDPAVLMNSASRARAAGFSAELRLLAVPHEVSSLGTVERYAKSTADGAGRWTASAAHDDAFYGAVPSLRAVLGSDLLNVVVVVDRSGAELYRGTHSAGVLGALSWGRRLLNVGLLDLDRWWSAFLESCEALLARGECDPDVLGALRALVDVALVVLRLREDRSGAHDLQAHIDLRILTEALDLRIAGT